MFEERFVSPVLAMVYYTAMLVLGITWAVVSQSGDKPWPLSGTRTSLRILKRNQFDQFRRNQIEGFEISNRFHRVTRNNELLLGRLNRINERKKAAISRFMEKENDLQNLEENLQTRARAW